MSYGGSQGEQSAIAVPDGSARSIEFASGTVGQIVATGALTAGRYGLYRWEMPARPGGASPHFHRGFSEAFYVIAGEPTFYDGRAWTRGRAGDFLYIPEGGIHGFRNESGSPASMLILFAPGVAREAYFEDLAAMTADGRRPSPAEWAELYARHDQVPVEG